LKLWKLPDQVVRLSIILLLVVGALIFARLTFVPKSFGIDGHYRSDALVTIINQPVKYAGSRACGDCHSDMVDLKSSSFHRNLACEVCHGPGAKHADAPDKFLPIIPRKRDNCTHCHDYLISRPTGFPQINEPYHNPGKPCITCHNPHDPTPPTVPGTCAACHANIARTKAVSYHASLDCETCHEAKPEHRENPRVYPPTKPTDRAFCGKCHGLKADSPKEIPRVDISTHGERYPCWQCHYPHFPEAS
jgi:ribosomal protein S27AE